MSTAPNIVQYLLPIDADPVAHSYHAPFTPPSEIRKIGGGLLPTKYENQEDKLLAQGVFRGILLAGFEKSLKGGETIESGYRSLWMG